jgi:hypothetical protein
VTEDELRILTVRVVDGYLMVWVGSEIWGQTSVGSLLRSATGEERQGQLLAGVEQGTDDHARSIQCVEVQVRLRGSNSRGASALGFEGCF